MSTTKSTSRVFKVSTSVTEQLEMNKRPGQGRKIHGPYIHKTILEKEKKDEGRK